MSTKKQQIDQYQDNFRNVELTGSLADKLREYFSREEALKAEEKALKALKAECVEILHDYGTDTNSKTVKKGKQWGVAIRSGYKVKVITLTEGDPVTTTDWKTAFLALAKETGTDVSFAKGYTTTRKGATTLAVNNFATQERALNE